MDKILLVEDSISIIDGLVFSFKEAGYFVEYVTSIKEARKYLDENTPKLIILDISLPDGNGFLFYERYIKPKEISTIFLTAKDDEKDVVKGLEMGADDYVTKPFSTKELIARVNKVILRNEKKSKITVNNITLDIDKMELEKNGEKIILTSLEYNILTMLIISKNKVVKREAILDKIWQLTGNFVDDHSVTVYIKRIKDKLGENIITSVKGIGYKIEEK